MTELDKTKQTIRDRFPLVEQMQVSELAETLASATEADRPFLIDARADNEFAVSHLPGAVQASGKTAVALAKEAGDRPIVVYCAVGFRSSKTAKALMDAGFTNVANLEGSIFEWANEGHAVVRRENGAETPVQQVHPYDTKWGQMLNRELWSEL